jgi:hypothetical protein
MILSSAWLVFVGELPEGKMSGKPHVSQMGENFDGFFRQTPRICLRILLK